MTKTHKKAFLTALLGITSVFGIIHPASAQLIRGSTTSSTTGTTNLLSGTTSSTTGTTNLLSGTTSSTTGTTNLLSGTTSSTTGTTNLLSGTTSGSTLINTALQIAADTQTTTTATILSSPTPVLQNTTETTSGATLTNSLNATLQETTNTSVGTIAGASTDSQTTATVVNPTQIIPAVTSTLNNPSNLIQPEGQLNVGTTINEQGAQADTNANLNVGVGSLADVNICLDGSASLGSPDNGSLANCQQKPKEVSEPAFIGGLILLGAYITISKKKALCFANSTKI